MNIIRQEEGFFDNLKILWVNKLRLLHSLAEEKEKLESTQFWQNIKQIEKSLRIMDLEEEKVKEEAKQFLIEKNIKILKTLNGDEIKLKETPWRIHIEDENIEELKEYRKETFSISIDKKQLKEDIKQGLIIDWVYIKKEYILDIKLN